MGVYKVGKKWYIDYRCDGIRIRTPVGEMKSEAVAALEAIKTDIRRGEYKFKRERKIRFKEYAKEYLGYSKVNKRSWKRDVESLKNLIPYFGNSILSKITPRDLENYKTTRVKQVKPSTVNRELALLKNMFTIAMRWKYVDKNPVKEIQFFQERQLAIKTLDKEEIHKLINSACDHLQPIIVAALNTGMRRNEILSLRWGDIDFEAKYIIINETKNNTTRKVPMNPLVIEALSTINQDNEFVFFNQKTRTRIKSIKTGFKAACRRAGIDGLRFHDLRHNCGTYMVMAGVDIVTVKEILGHSDIRTTLRYCHPTPENRKKAVDTLASIFAQKDEKRVTIWSQQEISNHLTHSFSCN